ncbi:MAG: nitroreductase [Bacteroidota bacterium]|nr:nitroreductase [Bacteroidota bacterium]
MATSVINKVAETTETLQTIFERRSVRKYKNKFVDKNTIEKILDAGRMAPSAMNEQPWKFYVVTHKETIQSFSKEISKITAKEFLKAGPGRIIKNIIHLLNFSQGFQYLKTKDHVFYEAPVVIFITGPRNNEWVDLDIGMCAQNIMLAAKSMGLDTCPIGLGKFLEHTKLYPQLKTSPKEEIKLSIILGYGDETPDVHKRITKNAVFMDVL